MPRAAIETGQVEQTTISRRVMSEDEKAADRFAGMDIWEAMYSIKPDEWALYGETGERTKPGYCWYLYRVYNGQRIALGKFACFRDEDSINQQFGGPELCIFLQDPKYKRVKECSLRNGMPPISTEKEGAVPVDTRSLMGSASDRLAEKLMEAFRDETTRSREAMREEIAQLRAAYVSPAQANSGLNDSVAKVMADASRVAMEIVKAQIPAPSGKNDFVENIKAMRELGILPGSSGAGTDLAAQLDSMLGVFTKLQDFGASNGTSKRGGFLESAAEKLLDKAPEIVREVRTGIERVGQQRIAIEQLRHGPPPAAIPMPATTAVPPAAASVSPPPAVPLNAGQQAGLKEFGSRRIVQMIFAGDDGGRVMEFLYGMDPDSYEYVIGLDADGIRAVLSIDPILSKALEYPNIDDVVKQIVEYSTEERAARNEDPQPVAHGPN